MTDARHAVILVYSTSHAIRIEKLLAARGVTSKLVPVPRQLSSDCGVCVRIASTATEVARQTVVVAGIEVQGIVPV
jgi:hypothetical protein